MNRISASDFLLPVWKLFCCCNKASRPRKPTEKTFTVPEGWVSTRVARPDGRSRNLRAHQVKHKQETEGEWGSRWSSIITQPHPGNSLPPAKLHLLPSLHPLWTKHPTTWAYGRHSCPNHYTSLKTIHFPRKMVGWEWLRRGTLRCWAPKERQVSGCLHQGNIQVSSSSLA